MELKLKKLIKFAVAFAVTVFAVNMFTYDAHAEEIDFTSIQANAEKQTFYHEEKMGKVHVWAQTVHVDPLNKVKEVVLYGKFDLPLNSTDFGVNEVDNVLFLDDTSYTKHNEYIKTPLIWAPEDKNNKYDKQIFKTNMNLHVRGETIDLYLADVKFTVKISSGTKTADVKFLEEAILEHWNDYTAAKTSGIEMIKSTEDAYLAKDLQAKELVKKVKNKEGEVSQKEVDNMRSTLNNVFSELSPAPYPRKPLSALMKKAEKLTDQNGKGGERYTEDSFDAFSTAYARAKNLLALDDLTTILVPHEGEPLKTHRDFRNAEKALKEKMEGLRKEKYRKVNLDELLKLYDKAVDKKPSKNKTFSPENRKALNKKIDAAAQIIFTGRKFYTTEERVKKLQEDLAKALTAMKEIPLDSSKRIKIKLRYTRKAEGSVSSAMNEYFRDKNNEIIEEELDFALGEEVYISVRDKLINRFQGYMPVNFHLNGDDGTLGLVKVLERTDGNEKAVFAAGTGNLELETGLVVSYEKGELKKLHKKGEKENTEKIKKSIYVSAGKISAAADFKRNTMKISWKKNSLATDYKVVFRKAGARKWKSVSTKGKSAYIFRKLTRGGLYEFKVQGIRACGKTVIRSKTSDICYKYFQTAKIKKIKTVKKVTVVTIKNDGKATGYEISYIAKAGKGKLRIKTVKGNGSKDTRITLGRLKKGVYTVKAKPIKKYKGKIYRGMYSASKPAVKVG